MKKSAVLLGLLTIFGATLLSAPRASALESVAVGESSLMAAVEALSNKLRNLQQELNNTNNLVAEFVECGRGGYLYHLPTDSCILARSSGGGNGDDNMLPTPPSCGNEEALAWTSEGWICQQQSTQLPEPPTCEEGTETLHFSNGLWNCVAITSNNGEDGNDGDNGEDGDNGNDGNDGNDGNNGGGSTSITIDNNNTNINNNSNSNTVIIGGGSNVTPLPEVIEPAVGKCTMKKSNNAWACEGDYPGQCLNTTSGSPVCGCSAGYRKRVVLNTSTQKRYLCIKD